MISRRSLFGLALAPVVKPLAAKSGDLTITDVQALIQATDGHLDDPLVPLHIKKFAVDRMRGIFHSHIDKLMLEHPGTGLSLYRTASLLWFNKLYQWEMRFGWYVDPFVTK